MRDDSSESRGSASSGGQKLPAENKAPAGKPAPASGKMRPGAKVSSAGLAAGVAKKAGGGAADDLDAAPLYAANKLKNNRFRDEAKLKLLKWNFASPRQEFVDQLKEQV